MAVWLVRAGRHGEREELALEKGLCVAGWEEIDDLAPIKSKQALEKKVRTTYSDAGDRRISSWTGQLWTFRDRISKGDLVVLPLKRRSAIAIGRITGDYRYRPELPADARHTRTTEWLVTDLPRTKVDQDLLYSLGSLLTVCQIQRHQAEQRIEALLSGTPSPVEPDQLELVDVEEYAGDQIRAFIRRAFKGHEFARLVDEILKAQGYRTKRSSEGPDGGVDIVAGAGPMGFDSPRLCVQVKSGESAVDVSVLRELQGTMKNFGTEQGLLVSWGGFTSPLLKEARRLHFEIRLWDAGDLVANLQRYYDALSPEIQADLPLKQIWILVPEPDGDEG